MKFPNALRDVIADVVPYIDLARPYNAGSVLVAFACGFYFFEPTVAWHNLAIGLFITFLLHSLLTIQNDLQDVDVDTANKRVTPLTNGQLAPKNLEFIIINLVFVSMALAWFCTYKLYALGLIIVYLAVGWMYNKPPFFGSRNPIMSIALLGPLYTLLPLIGGLLISGHHPTHAFIYFAVALTINRMSISLLKDFKDATGDKKLGKRTFYLVYGKRAVVIISCIAACLYYPLLFNIVPHDNVFASSTVLLLGALNLINRLTLLRAKTEKHLNRIFQRAFVGEIYFEGALLACFLASY